jgi:hypothetical protein
MAKDDIKLEDGQWNNWGLGWQSNQPDTIIGSPATIKMYKQMFEVEKQLTPMHQIMKDVKTSVEYVWPGVSCQIEQSYNSPSWVIMLSKVAGGVICHVQEHVTNAALEEIQSDTQKGIWIIQEVISKLIKQLEKVVTEQAAKTPAPQQGPFQPEVVGNAISDSKDGWVAFTPKYYGVAISESAPKVSYESIFKSEAPKVESLEDMYDKAPVEVKKKKSKSKVKLTAAELEQQKLNPKPKLDLKALNKIMDEQLKGIVDEAFKESPLLKYLKSPQKVKFKVTDSGQQGETNIYAKPGYEEQAKVYAELNEITLKEISKGAELKEEPMYLTNWKLTEKTKKL